MSRQSEERFSGRAGNYARFRPGYPEAVVGLLAEAARLGPEAIVVDIGSGTGISSRLFLDAGYTVYGVEPNAEMRAAAEESLARYRGFHSIDGRAEATTLPDAFADLVIAATAFHWFDSGESAREFRRIGKPGALTALIWNTRAAAASQFMQEYDQLLIDRLPEYAERWGRERGRAAEPAQRLLGEGMRVARFANRQDLSWEAFVGRVASSSYVPLPGSERYRELLADLEGLFSRHQQEGVVSFLYDTCTYYGVMG